jgi:hypothetical protein
MEMPRSLIPAIQSLLVAVMIFLAPSARAVDYVPLVNGSMADGEGEGRRGAAWSVLVCEHGNLRPIAWFGAVKPAGKKSAYLYLIVFKTRKDYDGAGFDLSARAEGSFGEAKGAMTTRLGGKGFEMSYDLLFDVASHELTKGTLRINEQELKLEETRVYIADITGESPENIPIQVELPEAPDVSNPDFIKWGGPVAKTIEELKRKSPEMAMVLRD